jgi:hypothetical protein
VGDIVNIILKQGFGYVLFIGALFVVLYLFRLLMAEKDRRSTDVKDMGIIFTNTAKDLLNGNANLQKSIDTLTSIINTKRFK